MRFAQKHIFKPEFAAAAAGHMIHGLTALLVHGNARGAATHSTARSLF
jgi:hypothetical protein